MISSTNIAQAVYELSQKEHNGAALSDNLVLYLEKNHALALLPNVIAQLQYLQSRGDAYATIRITSPYAMDKKILGTITKTLDATDAPQELQQQPELIGGFVAEYKGVVYDASVQTQLTNLKQALTL